MGCESEYDALDSSFVDQIIMNELGKYLADLEKCPVPSFTNHLEIELLNTKLKYYLPEEGKAYHHEALWACPLMFSAVPLDDFLWLLNTIIFEKHLVFVSTNLSLLTSVIIGILGLIKPLQWVHACVCTLPNELIDMLSTPFPVIIGLAVPKSYADKEQMEKMYDNCTFVYLDEGCLIHPTEEAKEAYFPEFVEKLRKDISGFYGKLNPWQSGNKFLNSNGKGATKRNQNLIYSKPSAEELENSINIIDYLSVKFNKVFKQALPAEPMHTITEDGKFYDVEAMSSKMAAGDSVLEKLYTTLFKTQTFLKFVDDFYPFS